ncbi:PDZ domain-containing protein [Humisphaera borealis]|uniref:PDZ domain-containing protein n=1 Tax=Humisphaera borealis TaxID=2807512 RepID=A0A7M2WWD6_9BACT|nr:hypothetical protein [Humisphaera borealis]QOV89151.1 hypothetical protein IPV69_23515 [Humisphaera borealis]
MRGAVMLSLLIGVAIMAYLWSTSAETASKVNRDVRQEMAPVTGRGPDGGSITDSAEFTADRAGLAVAKVKPGSYYEVFFGLKAGDVIVRAGDIDLKGQDETSAQTFLMDAAQKKRELVVMRAGARTTLTAK